MVSIPIPFLLLQYELVCDRGNLQDLATSLFFVGVLIGSAVTGFISDK